jgi:membrane protein required for colicin V production
MTIFDYVVIAILAISVIISISRGLVKEVLSIAGWFVALYVAKTYANQIMPLLPDSLSGDSLRVLVAFVVLFVSTLILAGFVSMALSTLFSKIGLGWLNNLLGGFFGLARGMIIISVIVFLAGLTSFPKDARWQNAMFSAPIEAFVLSILAYAPDYIKKQVSFD